MPRKKWARPSFFSSFFLCFALLLFFLSPSSHDDLLGHKTSSDTHLMHVPETLAQTNRNIKQLGTKKIYGNICLRKSSVERIIGCPVVHLLDLACKAGHSGRCLVGAPPVTDVCSKPTFSQSTNLQFLYILEYHFTNHPHSVYCTLQSNANAVVRVTLLTHKAVIL